VEAPIPDWLQEAYDASDALSKTDQLELKSGTEGNAVGRKRENSQMADEGHGPKAGPAVKLDQEKQLARVRRICRSIPGTIEKISHGEPTFFTPKRVFASLIEEAPDIYFRPPYVGVSGWVGVEPSKLDDEQLGALIREAFRFIDLKSRASRRSKTPQPVQAERRAPRRAPRV
jgi:hypothetical protein